MEYKATIEGLVKKAIKNGADEAEAYFLKEKNFDLRVRNGEVETVRQSTTNGLGLTVFKDKRQGFSHTSDLSEGALDDFVKKTVKLSLLSEPLDWNGLPDIEPGTPKDLGLFDPEVSDVSQDEKMAIAKKVEKIALGKDKRISNTNGGSFTDTESEVILVNSKGISRSFKKTNIGFSVGVIVGEGDGMQSGGWSSRKTHFKNLESIESVAETAVDRAVRQLGPRSVKTQKVPCVMYRTGAASRFWRGVLMGFGGQGYQKGTCFLKGLLDKPIASSPITLVDDPTIPGHVSSQPIDGEGKLTRKNTLIENGILKMLLYDSMTARRYGVKTNTIATRYGYITGAYASTLNVMVENGETPIEKIISGISNGFLVTDLRGMGTDSRTGNFSVGVSGFWISNGEIAYPVAGVTLGGKTLDLLRNIEVLADDIDLRGQLNSPSFKISEILVGGK